MVYLAPPPDKASEMFIDASSRMGGISIHCNCGITHHDVGGYIEYVDKEDYPLPEADDHTQLHDETIIACEIDQKVFVNQCKSCAKKLKRYEDFIWEHRDIIRDYLKIRIDREKQWAEQEHVKNILAGISTA